MAITHARFGHLAALITTKAARWSFEMACGASAGIDDPNKPMRDDPVERFLTEIREVCNLIEEDHKAADEVTTP